MSPVATLHVYDALCFRRVSWPARDGSGWALNILTQSLHTPWGSCARDLGFLRAVYVMGDRGTGVP